MAELIADRCYKVLGFKPKIVRPAQPSTESFPKLDYQIEKLKSTGFKLNKNIESEIDATLAFCQNEFTRKNDYQ